MHAGAPNSSAFSPAAPWRADQCNVATLLLHTSSKFQLSVMATEASYLTTHSAVSAQPWCGNIFSGNQPHLVCNTQSEPPESSSRIDVAFWRSGSRELGAIAAGRLAPVCSGLRA
jgi:hypothetical protein